jgi:hypothetical protein
MPREPEQVELHTRNNMVHEAPYDSSVRERTEEEDDDLELSEGENKDSPEMIRECTPHPSPSSAVCSTLACGDCIHIGQSPHPPRTHLIARLLSVFPSEVSWRPLCSAAAGWSLRFLLSCNRLIFYVPRTAKESLPSQSLLLSVRPDQ